MPGLTRVEAAVHGAVAAFDPSSLADQLFWHDGGLSTPTYHSGNLLSQLTDLSGNGRHMTQALSANAPTHGAVQINGINVIDFPGVDEYLVIANGGGISSVLHLFAVIQLDTVATNEFIFHADANSDSDPGWSIDQQINGDRTFNLTLSAGDATARDIHDTGPSGNVFPLATPFLLEVQFNGAGTFGVTIDGVTSSGTASGGGAAAHNGSLNVFDRDEGAADFSDGKLAAVSAYSSIKTGADLTNLRTYFNTRFGLS